MLIGEINYEAEKWMHEVCHILLIAKEFLVRWLASTSARRCFSVLWLGDVCKDEDEVRMCVGLFHWHTEIAVRS